MKKTNKYKSDSERNNKGQSCYNRGQTYEESNQVFLRNFTDADSDTEDNIFLRPCSKKEDYLEKQLESGDTLQTLSIQFNCPIAELKRINNIHRDNEVFARRIIKVPVRYYSLLSEKLVGVHKSSNVGKEELKTPTDKKSDLPLPVGSFSSSPSSSIPSSLERRNSVDDIVQLLSIEGVFAITNPSLSEDSIEYEDSSLLLPDNSSLQPQANSEVFQCSGSDWGLSWPQLLSFTLLLLLGGPVFYLLYHAYGGRTNNSTPSDDNFTRLSHGLHS